MLTLNSPHLRSTLEAVAPGHWITDSNFLKFLYDMILDTQFSLSVPFNDFNSMITSLMSTVH